MAAAPPNEPIQPLRELAQKYGNEFRENIEHIRQRGTELGDSAQQYLQQANQKVKDLEPQLRHEGNEVVQQLQSMEPVDGALKPKLLAIFSWTAILQFGYMVASTVSLAVLHPLISLVLGRFTAFILSFFVLPYVTLLQVQKPAAEGVDEAQADTQQRFKLLSSALGQGLLNGYIFANRKLSSVAPLAFLSPLTVAVAAQLLVVVGGIHSNKRTTVLGACVGGGAALQLLLGMLIGQLSVPYLLLTLLYAGATFAALQLYFARCAGDDRPASASHQLMLAHFLLSVVAETLVVALFSHDRYSSSSTPVLVHHDVPVLKK